jgi:hypothetical protein
VTPLGSTRTRSPAWFVGSHAEIHASVEVACGPGHRQLPAGHLRPSGCLRLPLRSKGPVSNNSTTRSPAHRQGAHGT